MVDYLILLLGHALVWGLGIALVLALPGPKASLLPLRAAIPVPPGEIAWTLGAGWFAGAFVLTLVMRLANLAGVPFSRLSIGGPVLLLLVLSGMLVLLIRRDVRKLGLPRTASTVRGPSTIGARDNALDAAPDASSDTLLSRWQRWLWYALLAWIVLRLGLLLVETATRPLYAWDSWMQWATKARVWFALKGMTPFAPLEVWLAGNGASYIDAAPHYPATVPLWQVWSALLIGRWDDSLTNFAWWATAVALASAIYGYLRNTGGSALAALTGAWLVASLPILDAHVALAGYADLPMAGYFTLAVLCGMRWSRKRDVRDLALFVLFAIALPTLKNPGKVWVLLLLPGMLIALLPRQGPRVVSVLVGLGMLATLALAQTHTSILGYQLHLSGAFPARGLLDAYFLYANWHLLGFAAVAALLIGYRSVLSPDIGPMSVTLGIGMLFLIFGFTFTNAYVWVEDQSTVNRATLHLAPLLVIWVMLVFGDWSKRMTAAPTADAVS